MNNAQSERLDIFTTCPPYDGSEPGSYIRSVCDVSRWSDEAGCTGILVYTDNRLLDPWLVSQVILQNTRSLAPLVAVQPAYVHPYTVAKLVASLGYLYGRRLCLNMVAGGFANDLAALNDFTPHDQRYDRLREYTTIIQRLLAGGSPVTFEGEFYRVDKLVLKPSLPRELLPLVLVSGSSPAGLAAAQALGATAIQYPGPADRCAAENTDQGPSRGIRVGIIAREHCEEAWRVAEERFPPDRAGQLAHKLAMKVSDSSWHRKLSDLASSLDGRRDVYWLVPFENYKTFCPYLVGSYMEVSAEIAKYLAAGHRTFILDVPAAEEELFHTGLVFAGARRQVTA